MSLALMIASVVLCQPTSKAISPAKPVEVSIASELDHPVAGKFVLLQPRTVTIGASETDYLAQPNERPARKVVINAAFYLGTREVTIGQFRKFVKATGYQTDLERNYTWGIKYDPIKKVFVNNPGQKWNKFGFDQDDTHPVTNVSWRDAVAFCEWLTREDGKRVFRLPTEAEWEYACRAGTQTRYSYGDDPASLERHENIADQSLGSKLSKPDAIFTESNIVARWSDNFPFSAPVGSFKPNAFGLFDMHGNAQEWVSGEYQGHDEDSSDESKEPKRILRGGCWYFGPLKGRSSVRHPAYGSTSSPLSGFRVAADSAGAPNAGGSINIQVKKRDPNDKSSMTAEEYCAHYYEIRQRRIADFKARIQAEPLKYDWESLPEQKRSHIMKPFTDQLKKEQDDVTLRFPVMDFSDAEAGDIFELPRLPRGIKNREFSTVMALDTDLLVVERTGRVFVREDGKVMDFKMIISGIPVGLYQKPGTVVPLNGVWYCRKEADERNLIQFERWTPEIGARELWKKYLKEKQTEQKTQEK